jgi:hypothetical protein
MVGCDDESEEITGPFVGEHRLRDQWNGGVRPTGPSVGATGSRGIRPLRGIRQNTLYKIL